MAEHADNDNFEELKYIRNNLMGGMNLYNINKGINFYMENGNNVILHNDNLIKVIILSIRLKQYISVLGVTDYDDNYKIILKISWIYGKSKRFRLKYYISVECQGDDLELETNITELKVHKIIYVPSCLSFFTVMEHLDNHLHKKMVARKYYALKFN